MANQQEATTQLTPPSLIYNKLTLTYCLNTGVFSFYYISFLEEIK